MNRKRILVLVSLLMIASLAATSTVWAQDADRKKTVIFDIDGGKVLNPDSFNPFIPQRRMDHGWHQAVLEPMFILNYETGKYDPWVAESMSSDDKLTTWTLKLKKGVMWSDGQPYTAQDVVFTMNEIYLKKGNETLDR